MLWFAIAFVDGGFSFALCGLSSEFFRLPLT